jgi:hypothetical protein
MPFGLWSGMADVFISYSRKDQEFVRELYNALKQQNYDPLVDWEGIPPTAEFLQEIYSAIESSNAFVFIITNDSITSNVCKQKNEHAVKHNKRLIPIYIVILMPIFFLNLFQKLIWSSFEKMIF